MSSDLLTCVHSSNDVLEKAHTKPPSSNSTGGISSSPSVSVTSADSPSQTSPSSACGSSPTRASHDDEVDSKLKLTIEEVSDNGANGNEETCSSEIALSGRGEVSADDESLASMSSSTSPIRDGQRPATNDSSTHQMQNGGRYLPQRLSNKSASRPRRLGIGNRNYQRPHLLRNPVNGQGDIGLFYCPMEFPSPSSNSSSPLTFVNGPMGATGGQPCLCCVNGPSPHHHAIPTPYSMLSNVVYPSPVFVNSNNNATENGGILKSTIPTISSQQQPENSTTTTTTTNGTTNGSNGTEDNSSNVVEVHVNPGVIFNVRVGDDLHPIPGKKLYPFCLL